MPTTLVFDIGGVLLDWNPTYLYEKLIPDPQQRAHFLTEVLPPSWNVEQDRGRPWAVAEAERIAVYPQHAALIRAFRARWHEMIPAAIAANVAVLERATAAGIPTYAITNFAGDTFRESAARFPFLTLFRNVVVSGDEGLIKPDAAIFRLFLDRFALDAGDCVFMDDSGANVAAAASLGFHTVHVTPVTDLENALKRHGLSL
jgi:2-haloacid dehalogenase